MTIKQRKKDHVSLTASGGMNYRTTTGFEHYHFVHNALPEVNMEDISTKSSLLGRTFTYPLFISSMTGGYTDAGAVNAIIAEFCEEHDLPFGVGSQRIMLEDPETASTFSVVRKKAPNAFIAANIGGAQLAGGLDRDKVDLLIECIEADAVIVHLNPLQELMQPEGDRKFKGIEAGIAQLVKDSSVPVIVKETGAGISDDVAVRLIEAGVSVIDIAGAGGTSWAKVENRRKSNEDPEELFDEWGIPTAECLLQVSELRDNYDFEVIASGGIRTSLDIAKSLCLGADFAATAQPIIKAVMEDGRKGLETLYQRWKKHLLITMVLLGCEEVSDLDEKHLRYSRG